MAGQTSEYVNPEAKATYQVVLNRIYLEYLERMFTRDYWAAWEAVKIWFEQLPRECQNEVKPEYEKCVLQVREVRNSNNQLDRNVRNASLRRDLGRTYYAMCHFLGDRFTHSLEAHGWLVKDASAHPKVRESGHLGHETS